jgi:hypothetical protein
MEPTPISLDPSRERLQLVRETILILHKAILDSERTAYEIVHGPIASASVFLQLLINDSWFLWLQPITTLIVQIDEALAAKRPPATPRDFEQLLDDTRALLSPSRAPDEFWRRYANAVQRDPGVTKLHEQVELLLS